jgi:hypothetical protein
MIKLFPARESLVSDIPAGDGKIGNIFYSVCYVSINFLLAYIKLVTNSENSYETRTLHNSFYVIVNFFHCPHLIGRGENPTKKTTYQEHERLSESI